MREQIRRDMLSDIRPEDDEEDDDDFAFGGMGGRSTSNSILGGARPPPPSGYRDDDDAGLSNGVQGKGPKAEDEFTGVDWESRVSGAKKVLAMDVSCSSHD